jgi:hypothetical protein
LKIHFDVNVGSTIHEDFISCGFIPGIDFVYVGYPCDPDGEKCCKTYKIVFEWLCWYIEFSLEMI